MPAAQPPADETARLHTLRGLRLLDTPAEAPWDSLARCAALVTGCPTAVITLVDESRQWFKARVGLDICETSRDVAFCAHAILGREMLEVVDARADARFSDNPLVTGEGGIRFYAGVPLRVDGQPMGTLCVVDTQPRRLDPTQRAALADLACAAEQLLMSHRTQHELVRHRQHLEDIVEQRTQALVLARRAAEAASEAKSAFLATMSHEIRTPMNGVLGLVELLQKTGLDDNQMDLAGTVRESAEALLSLIDDVLDFSKIEAGQMSLAAEPVELRRLVTSVLQGLQSTASTRQVRLRFECADDLAPWIESDAGRLRQILNNLVGNAVKFSGARPGGGQVLVLASAASAPAGPQLRLQVIDNGIGMTPEVMARIFKPFVQGEDSTTRQYGGTGLGLSISQRLAHLLGGWIAVDSEPGKGSTFTVHLPLRPCAEPALPGPSGATDSAATDMAPCQARVLVAEDNPINQKVIRRQLAMLGVEMDLAVDGEDALTQWREGRRQGRHALLLTDLHMPRLDGYALVARIRAEEDGPARLPVVALSAVAVSGERDRCLLAGMDDYLGKPVQLGRLGAMLQRWLCTPGQHPAAQAPDPDADREGGTDTAVVDDTVLPDLFDGDLQLVAEFQQRFLGLLERELTGLDSAARHAEWKHLGQLAHRLKSSCRTVGATRMARTCEAIENGASNLPGERLVALVHRLREQAADVRQHLQHLLAPADRPTGTPTPFTNATHQTVP